MNKRTLSENFRRAHELALTQARQFVAQHLPDDKRFFYASSTCDSLTPLSEEQAVDLLWRDINDIASVWVMVKAQDEYFTYIELLRYGGSASVDHSQRHEGHAPFKVLVPAPPFEWRHQGPEERGQFDLYWQQHEPFAPLE